MDPLGSAVLGPFIVAVLITDLELTEVVALVFALGAGSHRMTYGLLGAATGVAIVGLLGLLAGVALSRFPIVWALAVAAVLLYAFGVFLFRSTLRTYLREARARHDGVVLTPNHLEAEGLGDRALFGAALSVGMIETTEAVIVLVGLAAAGSGTEALAGFIVGGMILVVAGVLLHERIRQLKVPALKWIGTSLLFTFAGFWTLEVLGQLGRLTLPTFPVIGSDILVLPLLLVALVVIRFGVYIHLRNHGLVHVLPGPGQGTVP